MFLAADVDCRGLSNIESGKALAGGMKIITIAALPAKKIGGLKEPTHDPR